MEQLVYSAFLSGALFWWKGRRQGRCEPDSAANPSCKRMLKPFVSIGNNDEIDLDNN